MIGLIINNEQRIAKKEAIITALEKAVQGKEDFIIDKPETILFQYTTEGEFAKEFNPQWFLEVVNTDMSRCLIDSRLRLKLNGEIYWMRLEKE